jgi:hypothetical protein
VEKNSTSSYSPFTWELGGVVNLHITTLPWYSP